MLFLNIINQILTLIYLQIQSFNNILLNLMGCKQLTSHYGNQHFMNNYEKLQKDFTKQVSLFEVSQIKFPLSTGKMKIVDKTGKRVKLAGVNWSGGHAQRHCVSGLEFRKIDDICKQLKQKLHFNCVRLTFSLQMFFRNNVIDKQLLQANPQLYGKTSLQIFDYTIERLTSNGLMVILNNHTSKSMWCCTPWDGDGLWYTDEYPEQKFYQCLLALTKRYKHLPRVIGMDLRNQIRSNFTTKPTWGSQDKLTDWKIAAQKAADLIHQISPQWLIFVGGIDSQLDFTDVIKYPLKLKIPNKLVYTGHFYGFSWLTTIWQLTSYQWFKQKIFNLQLYVRGTQGGVPFLLGQFGNNCQDIPWKYLMRLIKQYDLDWTYWCLDGYKCKDKQDQTFGIYSYRFDKIRHQLLFEDLKKIGDPKNKLN